VSSAAERRYSSYFSVPSGGEAALHLPLVSVPGRAEIEPELALVYDSSRGNGPLGVGFSLAGASAITLCPKNLALDREIRAVRFDASDTSFCLDGNGLIRIREEDDVVEFRSFPDKPAPARAGRRSKGMARGES